MTRWLLCQFAFLFSFSIAPSFAADTTFEGGIAKASIALGASDSVNASVETTEPPTNYAYSKAYMWGGDDTTRPKTIIKAIIVVRNGQTLFIPLSVYADLGNPLKISLEKLPPHGFRLIIRGGDAAGAYKAMLDFNQRDIYHRKVLSGEFPKEVWEDTTFSFNHLNN
jgi:hypothetical protein